MHTLNENLADNGAVKESFLVSILDINTLILISYIYKVIS